MFHGKLKPVELSLTHNPNFPARPYTVKLEHSTSAQRDQMTKWCGEHFGAHTPTWNNPRWAVDRQHSWWYHFKNEGDAALFLMRWS